MTKKMTLHNFRRPSAAGALLLAFFISAASLSNPTAAFAANDKPGRGQTANFEVSYLEFIIDHHYAALRMTELAAGTQQTAPTAAISPQDGTSPSPNFAATPAKAKLDELKGLARRNNRTQREEILTAQQFLRVYYGIDYQPQISAVNQQRISILESAAAGADFDIAFMRVFSRHHFTATKRSIQCLVGSDIKHTDLERYCRGIVMTQLGDIDEMRNRLCDTYGICDYQPFSDPDGSDSNNNP